MTVDPSLLPFAFVNGNRWAMISKEDVTRSIDGKWKKERRKLIPFKHKTRFPSDDSWAEMPSILCRILQMNFLDVGSTPGGNGIEMSRPICWRKNIDVLSFMSHMMQHKKENISFRSPPSTYTQDFEDDSQHTAEKKKSNILDIFWAFVAAEDAIRRRPKKSINFMEIAEERFFFGSPAHRWLSATRNQTRAPARTAMASRGT